MQAERLWKRYLEQDDSPVTDFFGGQLQNNVTCHVCKHRFTSYEFFKVGWRLRVPARGRVYGHPEAAPMFQG